MNQLPAFLEPFPAKGSNEENVMMDYIAANFDVCLHYFPTLTQQLFHYAGVGFAVDFVRNYGSTRVSCKWIVKLLLKQEISCNDIDIIMASVDQDFVEVQSKLGFISCLRRHHSDMLIGDGYGTLQISHALGVSHSTIRRSKGGIRSMT